MKILAFGAHPDDVEVGAGGTLAKLSQDGHEVKIVVTTVPNKRDVRIPESQDAARILGAQLTMLDLPPTEVKNDRPMVKRLDEMISDYQPDIVLTHWHHDSHQDHQALSLAVLAACRKNRCSVYMYEQTIPGGIVPFPFQAHVFIDISTTIDRKLDSVRAHASQLAVNRDWWQYGIKGRAANWGYMINAEYAEAFSCVKVINKL